MQKNEIFTGKVIDYTHDGLGIVKIDNFPIFIEDVIEGEEVEFKIIKFKNSLHCNKKTTIKKLLFLKIYFTILTGVTQKS